MLADVIWFPKSGSTIAGDVDRLLLGLSVICGGVGFLVAVLLIGFAIRFRRRPGDAPPPPMKGWTPLEISWTLVPLGVFFFLFGWGATVYYGAYRPPDDAMVIYGIGKQWMWKFQHPEGQREINELHLPVGRPVRIILTSEDVIHSFFVPEFRVHQDVLPGRYTAVWAQATAADTYKLLCSQYCGTGHAIMIGKIVAMKPADYQEWLEKHAEGSLALEGRKTFLKYRCISCHGGDGAARAPTLEELFGRTVPLRDGRSVRADEAYLRESILRPSAKVVAGYEDRMPSFAGQMTEEEVIQLIAFIQALGRGQTPRRVEDSPPPP